MIDPRVDKPFERERRTTELPGTGPVRGASEASGTRRPPPGLSPDTGTGGPTTLADILAEMRALRTSNAQLEGRVMGEFAEAVKKTRNDVVAPAERRVEAAETRADDLGRSRDVWKRWAVVAGVFAGTSSATCVAALATSLTADRQVVQVAEAAAETKAAELAAAHETTRDITVRNTARLDRMDDALAEILAEVRSLKHKDATAVEVPKPKKPRAK